MSSRASYEHEHQATAVPVFEDKATCTKLRAPNYAPRLLDGARLSTASSAGQHGAVVVLDHHLPYSVVRPALPCVAATLAGAGSLSAITSAI